MTQERPIRIGVVGIGGIAQHQHIPGYLRCPNVEPAALWDIISMDAGVIDGTEEWESHLEELLAEMRSGRATYAYSEELVDGLLEFIRQIAKSLHAVQKARTWRDTTGLLAGAVDSFMERLVDGFRRVATALGTERQQFAIQGVDVFGKIEELRDIGITNVAEADQPHSHNGIGVIFHDLVSNGPDFLFCAGD